MGRMVRGQSLAPFAFYRLREAGVLTRLPADVQRGLQNAYYAAAGRNAVQRRETETVLRALDDARIETVLMKGTPLACTVYADTACRLKGTWTSGSAAAASSPIEAFSRRAMRRAKSDRPAAFVPLTGGEQQLFGQDPVPAWWSCNGLRSAGVGAPGRRGRSCRDLGARVGVTIEGRSSWGMAPEDLLIHVCLHLAINHGFSEPALRNLLDVHLVASRLSPDWVAVVDRQRRGGLPRCCGRR